MVGGMSVRRIAVVLLVAGLASGCSGSDGKDGGGKGADATASAAAAASASAASARAVDELKAAVTKLNAASYTYTMKGGEITNAGSVDRPGRQATITASVAAAGEPFRVELLVLDKEYFAKVTGLQIPGVQAGKWMRIDGNRIKGFKAFNVPEVLDPTFSEALGKAATTAERTPTGVKGTLDLTQGAVLLDIGEVRQLGERARAVPFEATIDAQGRLTGWKMTVAAAGARKEAVYETAYTGLGAPVTVARPPAGQVVEAPAMVYDILQA